MPERPTARPRWIIAGTSAAVVLVLASGYAVALTKGPDLTGQYRTVRAGRGSVDAVVTLSGPVSRLDQVTASFPTSGAVSSVSAQVGQRVKAGDVLATMDPTSLKAALLDAEASLAQAQASLAADESTTASTSSSAGASSGGTGTGSGAGSGTGATGGSATGSNNGSKNGSGAGSKNGSGAGSTGGAGATGGSSTPSLDVAALKSALRAVDEATAAQQTACAPVLGATGSGGGPAGRASRSAPHSRLSSLTGTPAPQSAQPVAMSAASTPTSTAPATPSPSGTTEPTPVTTGTPTAPPTETPTATATPAGNPSPTTTTPEPTGTSGSPSPQELANCAAALHAVAKAQQAASSRLTVLVAQITRVAQQVAKAAAAASQASQQGAGSGRTATGGSSATGSGSSGTGPSGLGGGTSRTNTTGTTSGSGGAGGSGAASSQSQASRIASDRVAILQAQASVAQAQADLDGATLTAPIGGVVAEVGITAGRTASSSSGVLIVGDGAAQVVVNLPLSDVSLVKTGMQAEVTPAGGTTAAAGTVTSVDLLPTSSGSSGAGSTSGSASGSTSGSTSSSTPTYPVKVLVPKPPVALASGSSATVSIVVGGSADTLRIPVSAVSGRSAGAGTVSMLQNGTPTARNVVLGAVGGGWAQVLSGISEGDDLVIADVAAAIPTNPTGGLRGLGGGGFVRSGAGGPPAGGPSPVRN